MNNPFKPTQTNSLFAQEFRLEKLSQMGDLLERLNTVINWEYFRATLQPMINTDKLVNSGAKPYDPLLMFKILILQRYYNLGDHNLEYQILDRLTFCRFLNLSTNDRVPDEKTIWLFRERFVKKGLEKEAFDRFNDLLEANNLIANEGKIVDASFLEAPRQRNTRAENEQIKKGEVPPQWDKTPNKKRQKDTDARWTKKNEENHYGYKDHISMDNKHKFIDDYQTTDASVHDSQPISKGTLLDKQKARYEADPNPEKEKEPFWADSAYTGPNQEQAIEQAHLNNKVHEKGTSIKFPN